MVISLFDALSNAPMLSAYFGGGHIDLNRQPLSWKSPVQSLLVVFNRLQNRLEDGYEKFLHLILKNPGKTLASNFVAANALASTAKYIPKTFIPANDSGEFQVAT